MLVIGVSCSEKEKCLHHKQPKLLKVTSTYKGSLKSIRVYEIDSCEYLGLLQGYRSSNLSHKGNCKYCKLRRNGK